MVVSINKGGSAVPPLQGPASMDTSVDVSRRSSPHTTPTEHAEGDCDMHIDDPTLPQGRGKRNVTWWRLAMITFVFTCTGPGGLEQVMIAGGPIMALFGIFAVPFIYVMPQIFVVSELGSMMPTSAGNVVWVHRAFGRFTGFYNAWIFSLTNMIDMAVYPVLFGDYVAITTGGDGVSYGRRMCYRLLGLLIGGLLSLLSAKDVSTITSVGCLSTISFIVVLFFASCGNIEPSTQWNYVEDPIQYSLLGSSLLWLYTGWTSLGALAGETMNSRVLLHGMSTALICDIVVYLMAISAALTVARRGEWEDGYFVEVFNRIIPGIGPYFGGSVAITTMTLYVSAMICYSRTVWGMAEMGWAPKLFKRQLATGAPHYSVVVHMLVGFVLCWFDFGFIVQVEYTAAATSYILTYFAFVKLRYTEPDTPRPYKTPGGMCFAWVLTLSKTALMGGTMLAGLMTWSVAIATLGINVGVLVGYYFFQKYNPEQKMPDKTVTTTAADNTAQPTAAAVVDVATPQEQAVTAEPPATTSRCLDERDDVDLVSVRSSQPTTTVPAPVVTYNDTGIETR
jgi:amino acid transporter